MKKLAIFVEGKTERVFVEKLIRLMINEKRLKIDVFEAIGGSNRLPRRLNLVYRTPDDTTHEFYIQIVQSGNDERVGSDVRDNYESLCRAGFSVIIGIRDVYPAYLATDILNLRRVVRFRVKTVPVNPVFVLGVMEVEAWFLAEHNHFQHIHSAITCPRIATTFGFDPRADDMELRACPHEDLNNIYRLEGYAYRKTGNQIQRTVNVLDYEFIYYELVNKFSDLNTLVSTLEQFFLPSVPVA